MTSLGQDLAVDNINIFFWLHILLDSVLQSLRMLESFAAGMLRQALEPTQPLALECSILLATPCRQMPTPDVCCDISSDNHGHY